MNKNICVNSIFFAIFKSSYKTLNDLELYYNQIKIVLKFTYMKIRLQLMI